MLVNKTKERSVEASTTLLQLKNDCLYELLISIRNQVEALLLLINRIRGGQLFILRKFNEFYMSGCAF